MAGARAGGQARVGEARRARWRAARGMQASLGLRAAQPGWRVRKARSAPPGQCPAGTLAPAPVDASITLASTSFATLK